jgi:L-ascorbate metabolism protein UlaG (beta-lactamase superfamily)
VRRGRFNNGGTPTTKEKSMPSFRYRFTAGLVHTALSLAALCTAALASAQTAGKTEILWLGQSAVRITTPGGKVLVIDPWLVGNPRTPANFKNFDALGKVDLVLVTHAHPDHFTDAPALAQANKAKIVVASDFGVTLSIHGLVPDDQTIRLHKGGTITPFGDSGPKIMAVHAEHSSQLRWKNAAGKDETAPAGEPMGYIIEMENGFKVWHTGDTAVFGDMRLIGEMYRPDLVLASIDGLFTMNPADAGHAMRTMVKPKFVVPIHYGTFVAMRGTPEQLEAALGKEPGAPRMMLLQPGQKVEF